MEDVTIATELAEQTRTASLEDAQKFAIEAARLCSDDKGFRVVVLNVSGKSPLCDFFVLASATSERQLKSIARDLDELGAEQGFPLFRASGLESSEWVAMDFVDVVVHIFTEESRQYYDLDNLWGDAVDVPWRREEA